MKAFKKLKLAQKMKEVKRVMNVFKKSKKRLILAFHHQA